jgi:hypothetical protein
LTISPKSLFPNHQPNPLVSSMILLNRNPCARKALMKTDADLQASQSSRTGCVSPTLTLFRTWRQLTSLRCSHSIRNWKKTEPLTVSSLRPKGLSAVLKVLWGSPTATCQGRFPSLNTNSTNPIVYPTPARSRQNYLNQPNKNQRLNPLLFNRRGSITPLITSRLGSFLGIQRQVSRLGLTSQIQKMERYS